MMFHSNGYDNSRPDGFGVLEIVPQDPAEQGPRLFVPLKRTDLTGVIAGPLADLCLIQTFAYTRAQCDRTLEVLYRFPLPGDAAVRSVTVRFGEVTLQAELKERQKAEADYQQAKKQGQQAALTTRESPDVFTLQIAGIQPDQEVKVETHYVQLARMEGNAWTLRVPLTTAPRYTRSDETGSRHAQGQPLLLLRDPGHRFRLDLRFPDAGAITSRTHDLSVILEEDVQRVRLQEGEVLPDRDCLLGWTAKQADQHPALHVLLHEDASTQQVYFLALLAPPKKQAGAGVGREAILLVDHSGSMEGAKWEAADWAVQQFLNSLTDHDAFALGLFHNTTHWLARKPLPATEDNVARAIRFLQQNRDSGGTELGVALEQALDLERAKGERSRHLLVVTDAEVTDEGRILRLADMESEQPQRRRISVLCIDAAPNAFLATELAERGGGVARFLTSAPEEEDITTALEGVLEDWSAPLLTGLRLEVSHPKVQGVGRATVKASRSGGSALDIGDLPAGRAVWIAGRVPKGSSADLAFRVTTAEGKEIAACRRDLEAAGTNHPGLKALFGARRVLGLEYLIHANYDDKELRQALTRLGYDADTVLAKKSLKARVFAENARQDTSAALHDLLVREALDYGLASSETAFIAVRKEAGKPVEETVAVANALPAGWSDTFATPAMLAGSVMAVASPKRRSFLTRGGGAAPMQAQAPYPAAPPPPMPATSPAPSGRISFDLAAPGTPPPPTSPPTGALAGFDNIGLEAEDEDALDASSVYSLGGASSESAAPEIMASRSRPLFSGVPNFTKGEAVLFDSSATSDANRLEAQGLLTRLEVRFSAGKPDASRLDPGLVLLLYVDDLVAPRMRVRLADLIKQGGTRPLNIQRQPGQAVRLVLADPAGAWAQNPLTIEVALY